MRGHELDIFDSRRAVEPIDDDVIEPVHVINMAGHVSRALERRRIRVAPPKVEVVGSDSTAWSFEVPDDAVIVGADADVPEGQYPMFDKLRTLFRSNIGAPKLVRVDTDETYAEFRDLRRRPHIADLDARLAKLEHAFAEHVSDGHGGFGDDVEAFDHYLDYGDAPPEEQEQAVIGAITDAVRGGQHVDLGLPSTHGKVECWRDGDEIIVSARFPSVIATTGASLDEHFAEVVGCAEMLGCCGLEALIIGSELAPRIAGRRLLGELCGVAHDLPRKPAVGVLRPRSDAGLAAAMMLLQRCQRGDKVACREAMSMAAGRGQRLLHDAGKRLRKAQQRKAKYSIAPERWVR